MIVPKRGYSSRALGGDESVEKERKRQKEGDLDGVPSLKNSASVKSSDYRVRKLGANSGGCTRTNDEVHVSIPLCPVIEALVDVRHMQRLRGLKQLGVSENVYINATHNRFEHSLGVAHLSEKMCRRFKSNQPNLGISEKDVLCVAIAGLYHDIGHGPFSHVFDGEFQKQLKKIGRLEKEDEWTHERVSLDMMDAALSDLGLKIDEENLDMPLKQIGDGIKADCFGVFAHQDPYPTENVLTSRDFFFVKECILGEPVHSTQRFVGRPGEKQFLYDIVNNCHSGLDTDKIDYLARDKRKALGSGGLEVRFLDGAVVARAKCEDPSKCHWCRNHKHYGLKYGVHYMICFAKKDIPEAMGFFKGRFTMHSQVYTHKTAKGVEFLICDILIAANDYIKIRVTWDSSNPTSAKYCRISEAVKHPVAFLHLKDSIIDIIANDPNPELLPAQRMIQRYWARNLYKCLCCERIKRSDQDIWDMTDDDIKSELMKLIGDLQQPSMIEEVDSGDEMETGMDDLTADANTHVSIVETDFIVEIRKIHHGKGDKNPVSAMRFLSKKDLSNLDREVQHLPIAVQADEESYESHIPRNFLEKSIRIFNRTTSKEKGEVILCCFEKWLEQKRGTKDRFPTISQDYYAPL